MEFIFAKVQEVSLLLIVVAMASKSISSKQIAREGCVDECSGVEIPFPFGIGDGCFYVYNNKAIAKESFRITCDNASTDTDTKPKPVIPVLGNREVLHISLQNHTIRVVSDAAYDCFSTGESVAATSPTSNYTSNDDLVLPFLISRGRNKFVAIGCHTTALLSGNGGRYEARCNSSCISIGSEIDEGKCYPSLGCCESSLPKDISHPQLYVANSADHSDVDYPCGYAFVGEIGSYNFSSTNLTATAVDCFDFRVSLVYEWLFLDTETMGAEICGLEKICGSNSKPQCDPLIKKAGSCHCLEGYDGNPYLPTGCQDIDECRDGGVNNCERDEYCVNKKGGYECRCPNGYLGNATILAPCIIPPDTHGTIKLITGFSIGISSMLSVMVVYGMLKVIRRRKEKKERKVNFKRNGGLLLQKEMTANEGVIEKTRIFTRNELVKATDNFNANRILGCGGQGTVYKGMLEDGTIVAVKRSKKVDEDQLGQFINEVVILSLINHRNIVKLFGCCLETDVPMLVYEFVHNGTLYQQIHHPTGDFQMTWEARLRIAVECAGAIAYLHSSCSTPIYHRDIKSSNILLDDKYNAKISDFGTSRSISIEKTHVTTSVQGTFGYLDPEFFRSSQFSAKSDVYSFAIVLLELLTSKKSVFTSTLGEPRGLAIEFTQTMEAGPDELHGILDNEVLQHCSEEDVKSLTKLIERCLSMNLKKRPTMKEVAMTLETIKKSQYDKEENLANEEEIRMQVDDDNDSDNTNEDIYINNSTFP